MTKTKRKLSEVIHAIRTIWPWCNEVVPCRDGSIVFYDTTHERQLRLYAEDIIIEKGESSSCSNCGFASEATSPFVRCGLYGGVLMHSEERCKAWVSRDNNG